MKQDRRDHYIRWTIVDFRGEKFGPYDNLDDVASVVGLSDSIIYEGYDNQGFVHEYKEYSYEEIWEKIFSIALFEAGDSLEYIIPQIVKDFYRGWRKWYDWHILQATKNITRLQRDLIDFQEYVAMKNLGKGE